MDVAAGRIPPADARLLRPDAPRSEGLSTPIQLTYHPNASASATVVGRPALHRMSMRNRSPPS